MLKVLLSRLGQAALVMLVVSAVSFVMFRYVGDPVASMSRENATDRGEGRAAALPRPRPVGRRAIRALSQPHRSAAISASATATSVR